MNLSLEAALALPYKSLSQRARVLTERWVESESYCPGCGRMHVLKYANCKPVADFACPDCGEDYELKSSQKANVTRIVDGAYCTMLERLRSTTNPNLFLLSYNLATMSVNSFVVIPKQFFVPDLIVARPPLSAGAQRAGWIGCNIVLNSVPQAGKINIIEDGRERPKDKVLTEWSKTLFLREQTDVGARGWILDIMKCIEDIKAKEFSLNDLYRCEAELKLRHPRNKHIREKIRQQLQMLRDKGYLEFAGGGRYRLTA